MNLDDSIFEFALYDRLQRLAPAAGRSVAIEALRDAWRGTALRHCDLPVAIALLVAAGSLLPAGDDRWQLTETGALRVREVSSAHPATMEDQVARSVIKTLRDRVPAAGLAPRAVHRRRARERRGRAAAR